MNIYADLETIRDELKSEVDADDAVLLTLAEVVSRRIDLELDATAKVMFLPTVATKRIPAQSWRVEENGQSWNPHFPLQEVDSVSINGTTDISEKVEVDDRYRLHWKLDEEGNFLTSVAYEYGVKARLYIEGTWVFHSNYADAWLLADVLAANITTTEQSIIEVAEGNFAVGDFIRIGSEWMEVVAMDVTDMTVNRGMNGSTAATHNTPAEIYTFQVEPLVARAVARQVGLMYSRRGAYNSVSYTDVGTSQFPEDELAELKAVVAEYRSVLDGRQ